MKKYYNLCSKYGINNEDIKEGIKELEKRKPFGYICNPMVMCALCELLLEGDIQGEKYERAIIKGADGCIRLVELSDGNRDQRTIAVLGDSAEEVAPQLEMAIESL